MLDLSPSTWPPDTLARNPVPLPAPLSCGWEDHFRFDDSVHNDHGHLVADLAERSAAVFGGVLDLYYDCLRLIPS